MESTTPGWIYLGASIFLVAIGQMLVAIEGSFFREERGHGHWLENFMGGISFFLVTLAFYAGRLAESGTVTITLLGALAIALGLLAAIMNSFMRMHDGGREWRFLACNLPGMAALAVISFLDVVG